MRPDRVLAVAVLCGAVAAAPASAGLSVQCGPPPDGAICADGPWFDFASMTVHVVQGEVRSRYDITVGAGHDLKVAIDEATPGYRGRAEAILIGGSVVATKSDGVLPNQGQDLLGDPLLAAQEVGSFLQIALPKGPRGIAKSTPVRASGTRFLAVNTPAMSSYYGPPWRVEGSIAPVANHGYAFEFTFTYRVGNIDGSVTPREHVHRYSGRASFPPKRPRLPDGTSLAGWTFDVPGGADLRFGTLGEARRALGIAPGR